MREEKKYEVLPGVEIPDIKKIQEAASDFSISEVGEVETRNITLQPVVQTVASSVNPGDLNELQQLGDKVAEDEEKSKAESRARMDKIMSKAVQAPESIFDLKTSHIAQLNEEKRKQLEEDMKEAEKAQAEEDAKNKAREERRQFQQRLLEESREKAAKEKEAREQAEREAVAREEEEIKRAAQEMAEKLISSCPETSEKETAEVKAEVKDEVKPEVHADKTEAAEKKAPSARPDAPEEMPIAKKTAKMVSDSEAFDDFKEFLDDEE